MSELCALYMVLAAWTGGEYPFGYSTPMECSECKRIVKTVGEKISGPGVDVLCLQSWPETEYE